MKSILKDFPEYLYAINQGYCAEVPATVPTQQFVEEIINFLFPFRVKRNFTKKEIKQKLVDLIMRLGELLVPLIPYLKEKPDIICSRFFDELPGNYKMMLDDANAFTKFDPASESVEEVILCYPGFFSIAVYRLAHVLYDLQVPVLPRVMTEYAHSITGVDIHPGARIGKSFFIDHGTGTVIGETTLIGDNVKIYQGVTLGALFVEKKLAKKKRHPTIEDNVIIYARSTILGGETVIGHDTVIGGNVWLTESVPPNSVVYQKHKTIVRESRDNKDLINWVI
ncbi:MAG: serine acetyltransferase [Bacteroides sp. SM23_62_1]|nr:MAG: serine acetyltransferase [Bacteroides sp. SM23_62_1]